MSGACRSSVPMLVNAECDSLTSCLPLAWPHPPSISILDTGCDVVTAAPLREWLQNDDSVDITGDKIIRWFELSANELTIETYARSALFTWRYHEDRYELGIVEGEKPLGYVFFEKSRPLLRQVIDCLGEPEWYTSGYGPVHHLFSLNVELYFPKYGLRVSSSQITRQQDIAINEDLVISDLRLSPPGTTEEVISFFYFHSPEVAQIVLEQLKPWPGSLEAMIETVQADYCLDYPEFCPINEP
jgi:hypothetical protein